MWDELLVDIAGTWVNENRAAVGLARMLGDSVRLEAAYLLRSRLLDGDWQHDHILNVYLFVSVARR